MKVENLQPPDEPRTKVCPDCNGVGQVFPGYEFGWVDCETCNGTGKIIDDPRFYFDEVKADDERSNDE